MTEHNDTDTTLADATEQTGEAHQEQAKAEPRYISPLDASFQRPNQRQQAAAPSVWDVADAITVPSPTLDPGNLTAHALFAELDGWGVASAVDALKALHGAVQQVVEVREAAKADPTLTAAAALLLVADTHTKLTTAATKKLDAASATLTRAVEVEEAALRKPITTGATGPFAAELRALARSMNEGDRRAFITDAIASKDVATLGALLGAPPALSGLDKASAAGYSNRANLVMNEQAAKRVELMRFALGKLEAAGRVHLTSMERTVGAKLSTVAKLRAQKARAAVVLNGFIPAP